MLKYWREGFRGGVKGEGRTGGAEGNFVKIKPIQEGGKKAFSGRYH